MTTSTNEIPASGESKARVENPFMTDYWTDAEKSTQVLLAFQHKGDAELPPMCLVEAPIVKTAAPEVNNAGEVNKTGDNTKQASDKVELTPAQKETYDKWQKCAGKIADPAHPLFELQNEMAKQFATGKLDVEKLQGLMQKAKVEGKLPIILGKATLPELEKFTDELRTAFGLEIEIEVGNTAGGSIGVEAIKMGQFPKLDEMNTHLVITTNGASKAYEYMCPSDLKVKEHIKALSGSDALIRLTASGSAYARPRK